MKIDCYLSEHCGSYHELRENVSRALQELGLSADVAYHTITFDEAVVHGISGSPTVRLDGSDLFPGGAAPGVA